MDLQEIRKDIDKIDREISHLFEERMKLTYQVAAYKIENGKKVFDKQREDEKLQVLSELGKDDFQKQAIRELFLQIMSISRKKQYTLVKEEQKDRLLTAWKEFPKGFKKVACFGDKGSYTEQAMEEFFGDDDIEGINKKTFSEVIEALQSGEVDYGVLPIENSSTGGISDIYDLLVKSNAYIIGEHEIKVEQALIGIPGTPIDKIRKVFSHEQGIMQCKNFLKQYPDMEVEVYESTSGSVRRVKEEGDSTHAAISSERAAKYYGLEVLQANINQESNNSTRFIIITKQRVCMESGKKISICFEIAHESGTLYNMLAHFIFNGLNLTKIESRPIEGKKWEYRFFVEFEGNLKEPGVQNALQGLKEESNAFYLFGNF
ncbi:MAG: prephenate dehydratase [Clostridiales bacterium]|nr:prephenate dehydratase [Clostridiales bacterium]